MAKAMNILYEVGDNLYVNLTNRCSCNCTFCLRNEADGAHGSDSLWLEREPTFEEVMSEFDKFDMDNYREVVFCGYGEPTEAFDLLLQVAREVKRRLEKPIRINTNGQGSLICGRNIAPEMQGVIDGLSISLNTPDADEYLALTQSRYGKDAFLAMLEFAREAVKYVPSVTMTTVETTISKEQEDRCREICNELGVNYRIRPWV